MYNENSGNIKNVGLQALGAKNKKKHGGILWQ